MTRKFLVLGALCGLTLLGGCATDYRGDGHYRGGYYDGGYYSGYYEPDYYPYAYGPNYVPRAYNRGYDGYRGEYRGRRDHDGNRGERRGDRGNRDQASQGNNSANPSYRGGDSNRGNGQRSESGGGRGMNNNGGGQQQSAPPPRSGGPSGRFGHPGTAANPL